MVRFQISSRLPRVDSPRARIRMWRRELPREQPGNTTTQSPQRSPICDMFRLGPAAFIHAGRKMKATCCIRKGLIFPAPMYQATCWSQRRSPSTATKSGDKRRGHGTLWTCRVNLDSTYPKGQRTAIDTGAERCLWFECRIPWGREVPCAYPMGSRSSMNELICRGVAVMHFP